MSLGRYLVDAVLLEGQNLSQLARRHGISQSWAYELVARYREGGYEALEPRSRRAHPFLARSRPKLKPSSSGCARA